MNELVSRQAAIDEVVNLWADKPFGNPALVEIKDCIEKLPSAQQWIPCSERLPYVEYGESDYVLTTCGYRNVKDTRVRWIKFLYFNGGNWCYPTGETYEGKVYAWMPLPEPYKGETDG